MLQSKKIEFDIQEFQDGKQLLSAPNNFDLILLDIEIDDINGIEIARNIRTFNRDVAIIFISKSQNYLRVGYTVKADGYFIKPINQREFNYELSNVLKATMSNHKYLLDQRICPYKLYVKDILYIEYQGRKTIVHMEDKQLSTHLTLKEWNALLMDAQLVQCHKGYIVNLRCIKELKSDHVLLVNGEELNLGRKYKQVCKDNYYSYLGERL